MNTEIPISEKLNTIFAQYNFEITPDENSQFEIFLKIFQEYNWHTNLSAIRDIDEIIEKHFVDSIFWVPILEEYNLTDKKLLDIGSGWWFPGIPLKIICPNLEVTLLDSVGKKTRAQEFFIENLSLSGIQAINARAEELWKHPDFNWKFDIIVSRATAYIDIILWYAIPFLSKNGKILLYKMPSEDEKSALKKITKKLELILEAEFRYFLWGKERIIYVFGKK